MMMMMMIMMMMIMRTSLVKRSCAALGRAMKSATLCRKCKADRGVGILSFGVNTVQHAFTIKPTALTFTGCSHILKTAMS